jgi:LemA protein
MLGFILAGVIGLSVWLIKVYNTLTVLKNEVVNSWAQVETDYQFRLDLIPGLVKAVKGYAKHESETLEAVIRARSAAVSADGIEAKQSANEQLDTTLGRLLLLVESYPSLQANSNFLQFQNQLEGVEKRISLARRLFNENVRVYNTSQQVFPANLVSRRFGHEDASQFKAQPEAAKTPQFDF